MILTNSLAFSIIILSSFTFYSFTIAPLQFPLSKSLFTKGYQVTRRLMRSRKAISGSMSRDQEIPFSLYRNFKLIYIPSPSGKTSCFSLGLRWHFIHIFIQLCIIWNLFIEHLLCARHCFETGHLKMNKALTPSLQSSYWVTKKK